MSMQTETTDNRAERPYAEIRYSAELLWHIVRDDGYILVAHQANETIAKGWLQHFNAEDQ